MSEALAPVLCKATADVLEKMFFAEVVAEAVNRPPEQDTPIGVTLAFAGERRGRLTLAITPAAAQALAADFLGVEEAGPEQVNEVACELANMICGDALSAIERSPLQLSSPRIIPSAELPSAELPPAGLRAADAACSRSFDLGSGWLTASLELEEARG